MKPAVSEWVEKAEADFVSAQREARARKSPNYDLACFLCQQSLEKYLKAIHQQEGIVFPKTHNLVCLLDQVIGKYPQLEIWRPQLERMSSYAVIFRYPGESSNKEHALEALKWCKDIRKVFRDVLGITNA